MRVFFSDEKQARHNKLFLRFLFIAHAYHVLKNLYRKKQRKTIEFTNYSRTTFPANSQQSHRAQEKVFLEII
jgi:hypothetical protein